jgi:hypothetical protein
MSRELNPSQIWSQVPVANRLIEVNTKTGFSLTAGSYSVRASSNQRVFWQDSSVTVDTAISSVTLTRAKEIHNGQNSDNAAAGNVAVYTCRLTTSTNVQFAKRNGVAGTNQGSAVIEELF